MNKIENIQNKLFRNRKNAAFILLGDQAYIQAPANQTEITNKINLLQTDQAVPGVWGTLGTNDGTDLHFKGNLIVSKQGNEDSSGEILEYIKELYHINDRLDKVTAKVVERFIDFSEIDFKNFTPKISKDLKSGKISDTIPKLRLTVFLGKDEGALAFYEHQIENKNGKKEFLEIILPSYEPVENRDRVTYSIPIIPKKRMVFKDGKLKFGSENSGKFVLKILTFKRKNTLVGSIQGNDTLQFTALKENLSAAKMTLFSEVEDPSYALLKFDPSTNEFKKVENASQEINPTLKTLLLLHGTFSTTEGSFGGLRAKVGTNKSWLQKMMDAGRYKQIISFDHETVFEDAEQNTAVLFRHLNGVDFKNNPVDIITTSRGGLVGKYLICVADNTTLPIQKAAMIACANGSGYFVTGEYIGKLLGLLKIANADNPMKSLILALAQYTVEAILQLPGFQLMTPKSSRLTEILKAVPKPINQSVRIQPVAGDWDIALADGFWEKVAGQTLDWIIQSMLGHQNDWVIGTVEQKIMPTGYANEPIEVKSMHTNYLKTGKTIGDVHEILTNFLN